MMNYSQLLNDSFAEKLPIKKIARKIYFMAPSCVFENHYDLQLDLYEEISDFLRLPLSSIRLVGSAHTGFSLVKNKLFSNIDSDLDIAVVDGQLYLRMFEHAFNQTNGWNDVSQFAKDSSAMNIKKEFMRCLGKGIIQPDLMPASPCKAEWSNFFGKLGDKYSNFCKSISARVYAHESFMTAKQQSAIEKYYANQGIQ